MGLQQTSIDLNQTIEADRALLTNDVAIKSPIEEKKTILVVDDDPSHVSILTTILSQQYNVVGTTSGIKALLIADAQPIDMILLDIHMPSMNGYDLCHHLKCGTKTSRIPIIFVTGSSDVSDEVRVFTIGAVDYVTKPVNPQTLLARIRTHISLSDATLKLEHQAKVMNDIAVLREQIEQITRHDLKAPLNTIIVAPQVLLLDHSLTERQRQLISYIMECGHRMLDMINNSLDMFKMENNTYNLNPTEVNIINVLDDIFRDLSTIVRDKHLGINISLGDDGDETGKIAMAYGEYLLCYSLFSNLITNAIEASPQSGLISINVAVESEIVTTIENFGEVPEHIRPIFFEKLVTSGKQSGTGLGTYSAMLFAKAQNGNIILDNTVCGKTIISVALPAANPYENG